MVLMAPVHVLAAEPAPPVDQNAHPPLPPAYSATLSATPANMSPVNVSAPVDKVETFIPNPDDVARQNQVQ